MVIAKKNAVTEKNTPKFLSFWAVTKNLGFMNWLTKKQAKANKIARERKWKVAESCFSIWVYSEAISRAAVKQKPIIKSAQSMLWMWWCTTTKAAASAGTPTGSTPSSPAARSGSTAPPEEEGCGLDFEKSWSKFVINWRKNSLRIFVIFIFETVESSGWGLGYCLFFFLWLNFSWIY